MSDITSIQRYSIHDGDGIRTTVFFKGCPLRCTWCHNPETQNYKRQLSCNGERCVGCGGCEMACPNHAVHVIEGKAVTDYGLCTACGECLDYCNLNLREIAGKAYTVKELVKELKKDQMFYEQSGGGVTLSGGEVMTQDMDYIEELCKRLYKEGITITIDTCGFAPYENFQRILPYVETFLYDVKAMDDLVHQKYMGVSNALILENLKKLSADGARIYIRIPTVREVNGTESAMKAVTGFLTENKISVAQVNLLPYHNTGSGKYSHVGMEYEGTDFTAPSSEEMEHFVALFEAAGFHKVKIGG